MKMTPALSPPWRTAGYLYDSPQNESLGEDMFEAELPDGTLIAAGWSAEGDPNGTYQVTVTRGLKLIQPVFTTSSMLQALMHIESIADQLAEKPTASCTPLISE